MRLPDLLELIADGITTVLGTWLGLTVAAIAPSSRCRRRPADAGRFLARIQEALPRGEE